MIGDCTAYALAALAEVRGAACQLPDGAGVCELVSVDGTGAGIAEVLLGDGAGVDVVGSGLLVSDGLLVGDGLLAGDALLVPDELVAGEGTAAGCDGGVLTGGGADAEAGTGTGSVDRAAELGNRVMTAGNAGAALGLAPGGVGTGVLGAEADTGMGAPRLTGPAAAPCAAAAGEPPELVGPAR